MKAPINPKPEPPSDYNFVNPEYASMDDIPLSPLHRQWRPWILDVLGEHVPPAYANLKVTRPLDLKRLEVSLHEVVAAQPFLEILIESKIGVPFYAKTPHRPNLVVIELPQGLVETPSSWLLEQVNGSYQTQWPKSIPTWRAVVFTDGKAAWIHCWSHPILIDTTGLMRLQEQWINRYLGAELKKPKTTIKELFSKYNEPYAVDRKKNRLFWSQDTPYLRTPSPLASADFKVRTVRFEVPSAAWAGSLVAVDTPSDWWLALTSLWMFALDPYPDHAVALISDIQPGNMLGPFEEVFALTVNINTDLTFAQWLQEFKAKCRALETLNLCFGYVVSSIGIPYAKYREPLAQTVLRWERFPESPDGLDWQDVPPATQRWDCCVRIREDQPDFGYLYLRTDVYSPEQIDHMVAVLAEVLKHVVMGLHTPLKDWTMLPQVKPRHAPLPAPVPKVLPAHPLTWVERELSTICLSVTSEYPTDVHSDFWFGTESLLMYMATRAIQSSFAQPFPFETFRSDTTTVGIAKNLDLGLGGEFLPTYQLTPGPRFFGPADKRRWFLHQLEEGELPVAMILLRCAASWSRPALEKALKALFHANPILRTRFVLNGQIPTVWPDPEPEPEFFTYSWDMTDITPMIEDPFRPDVTVHRSHLVPDRSFLIMTFPGLVMDEASTHTFEAQLIHLYENAYHGRPLQPEPLPDYARFCHAVRTQHNTDFKAQLAYWRKQLENLPLVHSLPTCRPRQARQNLVFSTHAELTTHRLTACHNTASRWGVGVESIIKAAVAIVIARNSYQTDVVFATHVSHRGGEQAKNVLGPLENKVVMRLDLSQNPSYGRLMRQVGTLSQQAFEYGLVPFAQIVELVNPVRVPSIRPLAQIMVRFEYFNQDEDDAYFRNFVPDCRSEYELSFHFSVNPTGFQLRVDFSQERFEDWVIEALAQQIANLLGLPLPYTEEPVGKTFTYHPAFFDSDLNYTDIQPALPHIATAPRQPTTCGALLGHIPSKTRNQRNAQFWETPLVQFAVAILDRFGSHVFTGGVGELHLICDDRDGAFLDDPVRTAQSFVPDPFSETPGSRLLRTGYLAQRLEEGWRIHHLPPHFFPGQTGLIDAKAIEFHLRAHPEIVESAITQGLAAKEPVLWIHTTDHCAIPIETLHAFLKPKLPAGSELPNLVGLIRQLPRKVERDPNGEAYSPLDVDKLARTRLPLPIAEPITPTQQKLLALFSEVLGFPVGPNDSFFECGGHSLSVPYMVHEIKERLGVKVTLSGFFTTPTVALLSKEIAPFEREAESPAPPPPLTNLPAPAWADLEQQLGPAPFQHRLSLRIFRALKLPLLEQALQQLALTYPILNTQRNAHDGPGIAQSLRILDLSDLPPAIQEPWTARLSHAHQEIPSNQAFSVTVIILDQWDHLVDLTAHRSYADLHSVQTWCSMLWEQYTAIHDAFTHGSQPLPPSRRDTPYEDLSAAISQTQHRWAKQLSYWRKQLTEWSPLPFPNARQRIGQRTGKAATVSYQVSSDNIFLLRLAAQFEGGTLALGLHALWLSALATYSGQNHVPFATSYRRFDLPYLKTIGPFDTTLLLQPKPESSEFRTVLRALIKTWREGITHSHVPFERIRETLAQDNVALDFQIWMHEPQFEPRHFAARGIEIQPIPVPRTVSAFDLEISWRQQETVLTCDLTYSTDLWDEAEAKVLLAHLDAHLSQLEV